MAKLVRLSAVESQLKRRLRSHLEHIGLGRSKDGLLTPSDFHKHTIRQLHRTQRDQKLSRESEFVVETWTNLSKFFADGNDVVPQNISPRLELICAGTWQSDLFRLASLTWSVPVSHGYGRRMRFLIWDESNEKLVGLLALGDPVFNLGARDKLIGWSAADRKLKLTNIMDAYVLGALPPYNQLLGGKLISALVRTTDIQQTFRERYGTVEGVISGKPRKAELVMVTTTSALGRSSIYNRSRLGDISLFQRVGFTRGWGHFHIPDDLFADLRAYLRQKGHAYANGNRFGQGPNWRLRTTREGLKLLGLNEGLLRHGIGREVFVCLLAENALAVLRGKRKRAQFDSLLSVKEIGRLAKERWMVPRACRFDQYKTWKKDDLRLALQLSDEPDFPPIDVRSRRSV